MATTTVKAGQTWWDVGVELSGAWETGLDLALHLEMSMSQPPSTGLRLRSSIVYHPAMERYCHAEGVAPATLYDQDGMTRRHRIFSTTFNIVYS